MYSMDVVKPGLIFTQAILLLTEMAIGNKCDFSYRLALTKKLVVWLSANISKKNIRSFTLNLQVIF